jgi:hypothetical protein
VRRGLPVLVAFVILSGCGSTERPEGVAERWLLSLDQGAAGRPGRYGGPLAEAAALAVLPDWRSRDPGSLDRVEVGVANVSEAAGSIDAEVPFRLETTDGEVVSGTVDAARCGGDPVTTGGDWCIRGARRAGGPAPVEMRWSAGADASDWFRAFVVGLGLSAIAVAIVAIVRRRSVPRPRTERDGRAGT